MSEIVSSVCNQISTTGIYYVAVSWKKIFKLRNIIDQVNSSRRTVYPNHAHSSVKEFVFLDQEQGHLTTTFGLLVLPEEDCSFSNKEGSVHKHLLPFTDTR